MGSTHTEDTEKNISGLDIQDERQRALLLVLVNSEDTPQTTQNRAQELEALVDTMGPITIHTEHIPLRKVHSATMIGSGKVEQIKALIEEKEPDLIVFDCPISPRVQRNLESILSICVIDRDEVILQIFADRAATKEAVLQVELARLEYSLPRLTRRWTSL